MRKLHYSKKFCGTRWFVTFAALTFLSPIFAENPVEKSPPESKFSEKTEKTAEPSATDSGEKPEKSEEKNRFILTRLGAVHEGMPVDRGETIFLQMKEGKGGFTISKLDVLFIGKTRKELFDFQRQKLVPGDLAGGLKLAEWSEHNQLTPEGIALLRAMITLTDDEQVREVLNGKIGQMEYVDRLKNEAIAKMEAAKKRQPGADEGTKDPEELRLEAFGKKIPSVILDRYQRKIQPILLKRCGIDGCHQETSDSVFTLVEPFGGGSRRHRNLRNLESVFDWIDPFNPAQSPIMNHPPIADAFGVRVYPFGEDGTSLKDYEAFTGWLTSMAGKIDGYQPDPNRPNTRKTKKEPVMSAALPIVNPDRVFSEKSPAPSESAAEPYYGPGSQYGMSEAEWNEFNRAAENAGSAGQISGQSAGLSANIAASGTEASAKFHHADPNDNSAALRRAGYLPKNPPKDEFDPEPFNRKYHPEK